MESNVQSFPDLKDVEEKENLRKLRRSIGRRSLCLKELNTPDDENDEAEVKMHDQSILSSLVAHDILTKSDGDLWDVALDKCIFDSLKECEGMNDYQILKDGVKNASGAIKLYLKDILLPDGYKCLLLEHDDAKRTKEKIAAIEKELRNWQQSLFYIKNEISKLKDLRQQFVREPEETKDSVEISQLEHKLEEYMTMFNTLSNRKVKEAELAKCKLVDLIINHGKLDPVS